MTSPNQDILDSIHHRFSEAAEKRGGFKSVVYFLLFFAVLATAWSAFYTVPSDSVAVVQRFGKYLKEVPPGLHFKLPLRIDKATIAPVKRQLKQESGFTTPGAKDPYQGIGVHNGMQETQMVTGDLNAALVEWVVQYRISAPVKFLFEVRERKMGTERVVLCYEGIMG